MKSVLIRGLLFFDCSNMLRYELPTTITLERNIYNLLGQKITIVVMERQNAGYHQVEWNVLGLTLPKIIQLLGIKFPIIGFHHASSSKSPLVLFHRLWVQR